MKGTQENKLSMYYAVQKVCAAFIAVWNGLPAFVTAFGNFETNIGKIEDDLEVQETNIKGVSKDKDALEDSMIDKALEVANAVFAYASDNDNETLKGKVDFSRSDLKQARDTVTLQRCQLIKDEAQAVVGSLGGYGINNADLNDLQARIDASTDAVSAPREAITTRKGATSDLVEVFSDTDEILKEKMDKLMEQFKGSSPKFYKQYFDARIIIDRGIRHESEDEEPEEPETPPTEGPTEV